MKTLFAFGITFFLLQSGFSQVIDKKAEAILDQVSKKMQSYTSMKIDFTYIMENTSENIREKKSGTILIEGDKYRVTIENQIVVCDGKTVWTYLKDANEVQITEVDPNDETTPNKLLTTYNKNYRPKLIREVAKGGKTIQVIDLTPNKTQSFYKIRLEIDKETSTIVSSTIYDKNGTTFSYVVEKFEENPKIPAGRFTFNPREYPGIIVTDMR